MIHTNTPDGYANWLRDFCDTNGMPASHVLRELEARIRTPERIACELSETRKALTNLVDCIENDGLTHSDRCDCDWCNAYRTAAKLVNRTEST